MDEGGYLANVGNQTRLDWVHADQKFIQSRNAIFQWKSMTRPDEEQRTNRRECVEQIGYNRAAQIRAPETGMKP